MAPTTFTCSPRATEKSGSNSFGNLLATNVAGLTNATALTLDGSGNMYVTQLIGTTNGVIKKITPGGVVTVVATNLNQPRGLSILENGLIAVSDTGNHAVRLVNPANGVKTLLAGGNGAGFTDGTGPFAQFNQPYGLSKSPSGTLVVADRLNHRFRLVDTNGTVTTLYGMSSSEWIAVPYQGWEDGNPTQAEARDPMSATVSPVGTVFTTESYYHLVRQATGAPLGVGGAVTNSGTNGLGTCLRPGDQPEHRLLSHGPAGDRHLGRLGLLHHGRHGTDDQQPAGGDERQRRDDSVQRVAA